MERYLHDDLWLRLAARANAAAQRLSSELAKTPGLRLAWPTEANEVFVVAPTTIVGMWRAAGAAFYQWSTRSLAGDRTPREGETLVRLVTSFETSQEEIDRLLDLTRGAAGRAPGSAVTAPHLARQMASGEGDFGAV
jgi:threonine aldolase